MSEIKTIIEKLPARCPVCLEKLTTRTKGMFGRHTVPYCEKCDRDVEEKDAVKAVYCPCCNELVKLDSDHGKTVTCEHCGRELQIVEGERGKVLHERMEYVTMPQDSVIFHYPDNEFRSYTEIPQYPNCATLLVEGTQITLVPPEKRKPFEDRGSGAIHADLYYVKITLGKTYKCATPDRIDIDIGVGKVTTLGAASDVSLRVSDPEVFYKWVMGECTLADLEKPDTKWNLQERIVGIYRVALANAAEETAQQLNIDVTDLREHHLQKPLREKISEHLKEFGLACDICNIVGMVSDDRTDVLKLRVERPLEWDTQQLEVHEKGNREFSAKISLHGSGMLAIKDRKRLLESAKGQEWKRIPDQNLPAQKIEQLDSEASKFFSEEIKKLVYSVFQQIIQSMIDDTEVPIDDLGHFLGYMANTVQTFLNSNGGLLDRYGVEIHSVSVTILPEGISKSEALRTRAAITSKMTVTELEEKMRKFSEGVQITQAEDAAKLQVRIHGIEVDKKVQTLDIDDKLRQAEFENRQKMREVQIGDIKGESKVEDAKTEAALHFGVNAEQVDAQKREIERRHEDEDRARAREKEMEELRNAYSRWEEQQKLIRAQQQAIHEGEIGQKAHEIKLIHMEHDGARTEIISDEQMKATVASVVRSIEESDFDLRKKLEAYAYLQKVTERSDDQSFAEHSEQIKIDLDRLKEQKHNEGIREQLEIVESAARAKAEREESSKQADFVRDLEIRRMNLAHQVELIKLQMEMQRQKDEAAQRDQERQDKLREMDTMLKHLENMEHSGVDRAQIQADLDKLRAVCDFLKVDSTAHNQALAASGAAQQAERREMQDRMNDIYREVLSIERQREQMQAQNQRAFDAGRAEVDKAVAEHMGDARVNELFDYLKQQMGQLQNQVQQMAKAPAEAVKPAQPAVNNFYVGAGAAQQERHCANCGAKLPKYVSFCPNCGKAT